MTRTRSFFLTSVLIAALLGYMYVDGLVYLFSRWFGTEDYSHGIFVPLISGFLIWQSRQRLREVSTEQSWWGLGVIVLGLLLYVVGELSTLFVVFHVSLWVVIMGLAISLLGVRGTRTIAFPLCYLLTAIPLPMFVYASLSSQLQLWSSSLGVGCLQLIGVMAFREGNVIDLGPVQLQVAEACSGIRYLLPLTSLALLCAYFFRERMWKRTVVVLSAVPISIMINGFRIGMIGLLVEHYGKGAAEGFYHLFEGWVIFMVSFGLLITEMTLLGRLGAAVSRKSLFERLTWRTRESDAAHNGGLKNQPGKIFSPGPAYLCSVALFVPFTLLSTMFMDRDEIPPPRASFVEFPMQIDGWHGAPFPLEQQYIDALRFDDYVQVDYRSPRQQPVNFYAAYYRSQRKGQSAHSPQSCLPGGGWEIESLTKQELPMSPGIAEPFMMNRVVIQKGEQRQIVLYWFKQRDRNLTDEYEVKWYLLWDAFLRQRTDGALVRLASLVGPGESEAIVDQRLQKVAIAIRRELTSFVPD